MTMIKGLIALIVVYVIHLATALLLRYSDSRKISKKLILSACADGAGGLSLFLLITVVSAFAG